MKRAEFSTELKLKHKLKSKMAINDIKPESPQWLLDKYEDLKEDRDDYSGLHDSIMGAIYKNLIEYKGVEEGSRIWTQGLFPERLTKEILRLVEKYEMKKGL